MHDMGVFTAVLSRQAAVAHSDWSACTPCKCLERARATCTNVWLVAHALCSNASMQWLHLTPHSLQNRPASSFCSHPLMQDVEDGDSQLASAAKKRRRAEQDDIEFPDEVRPAAWPHTETSYMCKNFLGHGTVCCCPVVCLDEVRQVLGLAKSCC